MFKSRLLGFFILLTLSAFIGCSSSSSSSSSSSGTPALFLGANLTISGLITHNFKHSTKSWTSDFSHVDGTDYALVNTTGGNNDGAAIDYYDGNNANINLSYGTPSEDDMLTGAQWDFTSSPSDAKFYSTEVQKIVNLGDNEYEYIYEGNFDVTTNNVARFYLYIYATKDCTLSGTDEDGSYTYIFNNISLRQGWNAVISETSDGYTYNYRGGSISNTQWTHMTE